MPNIPDLNNLPFFHPILASRPDFSLEEEALACGMTPADLAVAWRKLWEAESRAEIATAVDQYIRLTSVPLIDAVLGVLQPPAEYAKTARYNFSLVFTHRGKPGVWRADLSRFLPY
jgi:hypothetical protein